MTSAEKPTVFVVDDDANVRASIRGLLKSAGLNSRLFRTAEDFLLSRQPDGPSCLILDVSLPGINGLDFQEQLAKAGLHIPIVFITAHGDIPMTVRAMKSGAVEFLTKPFDDVALLNAVEQALARDRLILQQDRELDAVRKRYEMLTPRERQVMSMVVSGVPNKRIASELGTREITIKVHRARVMHKMQAESLADLVRIAERLQLFRAT
jgi:FixJ family two-component response regulator